MDNWFFYLSVPKTFVKFNSFISFANNSLSRFSVVSSYLRSWRTTNNNNRICYKIKPVNKDDLRSLMFELINTTSKCQIIIMRPTIKYPTMSNLSAVRCVLSKHHVSFVWQNVHIRFSMSHMFSHSYILVEDNRGRMELRANVYLYKWVWAEIFYSL